MSTTTHNKSQSNSQTCDLPQEVISYIFRFLEPVDIRSASLVCHLWAKASEDPLLWKHTVFVLFTKSEAFSDYLLDSLKRRRVQHVQMRHTVTLPQVVQVCKRLAENLSTLSLQGCRCVNDALIELVLKCCTHLTAINLGRCRQLDVSKKTLWFERCNGSLKSVTVLDISCCKGLSDWTLSQIPVYLTLLESLSISGCKEVSLHTWTNLAARLTSLRNLDISRSDISDDILLQFSQVPSLCLKSINLSACKQLTDNGVVSLVKNQTGLQNLKLSCLDITNTSVLAIGKYLVELKSLDLNSCRQITDYALMSSRALLRTLQLINLYSCYQLTSKGLQNFFSMPKDGVSDALSFPLETLILNGCSLATDAMIKKCCQVLINLQELDISSCLHITDTGLQSITNSLTGLKVLKISWCANITDAGLLGMSDSSNLGDGHHGNSDDGKSFHGNSNHGNSSHDNSNHDNSNHDNSNPANSYHGFNSVTGIARLANLTLLDVSHCTSITDDGMASVYTLKNLKSLNLNMCMEITDVTLVRIANHMTMLQSLSLNGCNLITDTGLVAIAKSLNHLHNLDVSKCDHITDLSIYTLAKYAKKLVHLDLSMCCQITSYCIDELEANVPGLVSLQLMYSGANAKYL